MTLATPSRQTTPTVSKSFANIPRVIDVPNLIQTQIDSFNWFKTEGIAELLKEVSPIDDFTGNRFDLMFLDHSFREPKYDMKLCREKEITYCAPLYVTAQLTVKETGEIKEQEIFFGDIPIMTPHGTFIINGAERVVVSQLVRSRAPTLLSIPTRPRAGESAPPKSSPTAEHGSNLRPARETCFP